MQSYPDFLASKMQAAEPCGIKVAPEGNMA